MDIHEWLFDIRHLLEILGELELERFLQIETNVQSVLIQADPVAS
jgi:hypothetical protein